MPEMFVKSFDDRKYKLLGAGTGVAENQDSLKRIIEETFEISLRKVFPPRRSRNPNYWWNDELTRLLGQTLKKRRLAQRSRLRNKECTEQMGADYKKSRKEQVKQLKMYTPHKQTGYGNKNSLNLNIRGAFRFFHSRWWKKLG